MTKDATVYPITVKACDVVNSMFGPGLFSLPGGRVKYDQVYARDGGKAIYLARIEALERGFKVTKRPITWESEVLQHYDPTKDRP